VSIAQQHLVDRTRFLFRVPGWPTSLGLALVVAVLVGAVVGPSRAGVVTGLTLVFVPAAVGALLTGPVADSPAVGRDRSAALALVGAIVTGVGVAGVAVTQRVLAVGTVAEAVLVTAAGLFALRLLVLFALAGPPFRASVLPAGVQPLAAAATVAATYPGLATPTTVGIVVAVATLYVLAVLGLVAIVEYPIRRDWGVSPFEFVHLFLAYVTGQPADLERYFTTLGEPADLAVTALVFRTAAGVERARLVVSGAHPGPLPSVGGGTLPTRLAAGGDGLSFVPHGYSDHDANPTDQAGVAAICEAADRAVDGAAPRPTASVPVVRTVDGVTVTAQAMGDGALFLTTFAPEATDDVHHTVGATVRERARAAGLDDPLLVDAHNCKPSDDLSAGYVTAGSTSAAALEAAVDAAAGALAAAERGPLAVGVARASTPWSTAEGFGPLGLRALATRVGDTTAVYLLVDGNNLVAGLRERVQAAVDGVDVVEVATTDTHAVNRLDAANAVGAAVDADAFVVRAAAVAEAALDDLAPATAGTATTTATATVFGEGTVDAIATTTDRTLPLGGWFLLVGALVASGAAAVLFWLR